MATQAHGQALGASGLRTCDGCRTELPLREGRAGEAALAWICTACGSRHEGVLDRSAATEGLGRVRPGAIHFDRAALVHPPEAIKAFISRMLPREYRGPEQRAAQRHPMVSPVPVLPMDEAFRPQGDAFMMMTRDVSQTGLALISTRAVHTKLLAVELAAGSRTIQVVIRVARCEPKGLFYEIAGPFLRRIGP